MFGKVDKRKKWLSPIVSTIEEIVKIKVPENKIVDFGENQYFSFHFRAENDNEVEIYIAEAYRSLYTINIVEYMSTDSESSTIVDQMLKRLSLLRLKVNHYPRRIGLFDDHESKYSHHQAVYIYFESFVKDIVSKIWVNSDQHDFSFMNPTKYWGRITEDLYTKANLKMADPNRKKSKDRPAVMVALADNLQLKFCSTFPNKCKNKGFLEISVGQIYDEKYQELVDFINQKAIEHGFFVES